MAGAREVVNMRNIGNDENIPQRPQPNPLALGAGLQARVEQDPVLSWLSNLPEAKRNVAEAVIWPEVFCD
ncbi:hypothetical protein M758_1G099800 [Ceratodon purpureus]|uniref:Uncharacterized protein n=1 Tax=Ceratodon purpureus TaxID=3225 RepID=A0A8T0J3S7_CERPU|nr:hypothetical protein KC19_1G110500 [Ceratodon purpureus]KAG0629388.1 hypothetical protein M758_1G099800 [Ceratodon purpureus]